MSTRTEMRMKVGVTSPGNLVLKINEIDPWYKVGSYMWLSEITYWIYIPQHGRFRFGADRKLHYYIRTEPSSLGPLILNT